MDDDDEAAAMAQFAAEAAQQWFPHDPDAQADAIRRATDTLGPDVTRRALRIIEASP